LDDECELNSTWKHLPVYHEKKNGEEYRHPELALEYCHPDSQYADYTLRE
jgi:hypothetical protein